MMLLNTIIQGDHIEILESFPSNFIQLIITSPPYDELREYKGFSFDYKKLIPLLFKILKEGGVVVWVVNDQTKNDSETGTSFKQALYFKKEGFNLYDTMIFLKANPLPHTSQRRYTNAFEYMFIFSKGKPSIFNPILEDIIHKNVSYKSTTYRKMDGTIRKRKNPYPNPFKPKTNVWAYKIGNNQSTKDKIAFKHPAIFPEKLVREHIYTWSNEGDIVLDPMSGSGTTCKIAYLMKRQFIGIDSSEHYCNIARERINNYAGRQKPSSYWEEKINPYKNFKQKKIDEYK